MRIIRIAKKRLDLKGAIEKYLRKKDIDSAEKAVCEFEKVFSDCKNPNERNEFEKNAKKIAKFLLENKKFKPFCAIDDCFGGSFSNALDLASALKANK
jgi:hypothetical protein